MDREIRVAIIDNSIFPDIYKPVDHWKKYLTVPFMVYRAVEGSLPDVDEGFTHIILTGSEASILEREGWVQKELDFVRRAFDKGLALLGSCYGHQLLVLALLGEDHVRRCPQPEIGWIKIKAFEPHQIFGGKEEFYAFSIHFDEAIGLKPPFNVLAGSEVCPVQAFEIKGKRVWGIQFHPEINEEEARFLLSRLIQRGGPNQELFSQALNMQVKDSGIIKFIISFFLSS